MRIKELDLASIETNDSENIPPNITSKNIEDIIFLSFLVLLSLRVKNGWKKVVAIKINIKL